MNILAKQKNPKSKLWVKEFKNAPEAAHYLKVTTMSVYRAAGKYGSTPFKVKGWYVDELDSKTTETV